MTRKRKEWIFPVAHMTVKVVDCPEHGRFFKLIAGYGELPERKNTLFSGHVPQGMAAELRRLARRVSALEAKQSEDA